MQKKILVIQHVESEGPGLIGTGISRAGFAMEYARVYRGEKIPVSPAGFSAVIAMGGPMGVYEADKYPFIRDELRLLKEAFNKDLPVMGICLGAQMMARAAGARVYKGSGTEIGFFKVALSDEGTRDPLLIGLPQEFTVFQWHGDTFDVPQRSVNLASSGLFPHQLIRIGRRSYGSQFHFEVTAAMISDFLDVNRAELAGSGDAHPRERIIRDAAEYLKTVQRYGSTIIKRFLRSVA